MTFILLLTAAALGAPPSVGAPVVGRCQLGATGPDVSCIALGTLHLHELGSPADALVHIKAAMALGITTFDLADVYVGQPEQFGAAITLEPGLREQIQVVAKMDAGFQNSGEQWGWFDSPGGYDTSDAHLDAILDRYLTALNTTYIDIVLLHREDYIMDAEAVAATFHRWRKAGKVRHFGTSNHDRATFELLNSRIPLVANEIEISPINPGAFFDGKLAFHYSTNTTVLAWSPLGGDPFGHSNRLFDVGCLPGTRCLNPNGGPTTGRMKKALSDVGQNLSVGMDVVCAAWLLYHPAHILPILGTTNGMRLANQAAAVEVVKKMTRAHWYHIADAVGIPLP